MDDFQEQILEKLDRIIGLLESKRIGPQSAEPDLFAAPVICSTAASGMEGVRAPRKCDDEDDIPGFSRLRAAYPSGRKAKLFDARRHWRAQKLEPRTDEILCALSLYKRYYRQWKDGYVCEITTWIHQRMYEALDFVPNMSPADAEVNPDWWKKLLPGIISDASSREKYLTMTFGQLPPALSSELLCRRYSSSR